MLQQYGGSESESVALFCRLVLLNDCPRRQRTAPAATCILMANRLIDAAQRKQGEIQGMLRKTQNCSVTMRISDQVICWPLSLPLSSIVTVQWWWAQPVWWRTALRRRRRTAHKAAHIKACLSRVCVYPDRLSTMGKPPEAPNIRSTHWCQQTYSDADFCLVDKKLSLCRLHGRVCGVWVCACVRGECMRECVRARNSAVRHGSNPKRTGSQPSEHTQRGYPRSGDGDARSQSIIDREARLVCAEPTSPGKHMPQRCA